MKLLAVKQATQLAGTYGNGTGQKPSWTTRSAKDRRRRVWSSDSLNHPTRSHLTVWRLGAVLQYKSLESSRSTHGKEASGHGHLIGKFHKKRKHFMFASRNVFNLPREGSRVVRRGSQAAGAHGASGEHLLHHRGWARRHPSASAGGTSCPHFKKPGAGSDSASAAAAPPYGTCAP